METNLTVVEVVTVAVVVGKIKCKQYYKRKRENYSDTQCRKNLSKKSVEVLMHVSRRHLIAIQFIKLSLHQRLKKSG